MENQAYSDSVNSISSGISRKEKMADLESAEERCEGGRRKSSSTSISNNETKTKITLFIALCNIAKDITIEPVLFFRSIALFSQSVVIENFKLQRFCNLELNYTEEDCLLMNDGNHTTIKVESQHLVNTFSIYEQIVKTVLPLIIIFFAGSWSDRHGRKSLILVSLIGNSLLMVVCFLVAVFANCPPEILLIGEFIKGIGGGDAMFLMTIYSFIADRTSSGDRFYRMAFMNALFNLGSPVGTILGAILFDVWGYLSVFGVSLTLYVLCTVYVLLFIKDKRNLKTESSVKGCCCTKIIDPQDAMNTLRFAVTKRPGGGRALLLGLISTMLIQISAYSKHQFLWSQLMFNWSVDQFSVWQTIDSLYHQVFSLLASPVIAVVNMHDCTMGAILAVAELVSNVWNGCVTREDQWWFVYGASMVNFSTELISVAIRSSISKVCHGDTGKAFSLLAAAEVLWILIDTMMYAGIYNATLDTYPSTQSLVGAGFSALLAMALITMRFSLVKFEKKRENFLKTTRTTVMNEVTTEEKHDL